MYKDPIDSTVMRNGLMYLGHILPRYSYLIMNIPKCDLSSVSQSGFIRSMATKNFENNITACLTDSNTHQELFNWEKSSILTFHDLDNGIGLYLVNKEIGEEEGIGIVGNTLCRDTKYFGIYMTDEGEIVYQSSDGEGSLNEIEEQNMTLKQEILIKTLTEYTLAYAKKAPNEDGNMYITEAQLFDLSSFDIADK